MGRHEKNRCMSVKKKRCISLTISRIIEIHCDELLSAKKNFLIQNRSLFAIIPFCHAVIRRLDRSMKAFLCIHFFVRSCFESFQ